MMMKAEMETETTKKTTVMLMMPSSPLLPQQQLPSRPYIVRRSIRHDGTTSLFLPLPLPSILIEREREAIATAIAK